MMSSQLENFAQKNSNIYNFKCVYCGDSKKSKTKVRGYLYPIGDNFNYRCHNCGKSISFKTFLKDNDANLYERYIFEKFKGNGRSQLKLTPLKLEVVEVKKKV